MSAGHHDVVRVAVKRPADFSTSLNREFILAESYPLSLGTNTAPSQQQTGGGTGMVIQGLQDTIYRRLLFHQVSGDVPIHLMRHFAFAETEAPGFFVLTEQTIGSDQVTSDLAAREIVLDRLEALYRDGEVDDLGRQVATEHAYRTATRLVERAATDLSSDFPVGSPSLDSEGGIRITWFHGNREVQLVCPGSSGTSPFIYHEAGTDYDLEELAGNRSLVRWLQWLTNRR